MSIDFSPTAPYKHSVPSHLPPQHHPPPLRKLSSLSPNFPSSIRFFANIAPQPLVPRFLVSNSLLYLFRSMVRFVARGRRVCSDIISILSSIKLRYVSRCWWHAPLSGDGIVLEYKGVYLEPKNSNRHNSFSELA